MASVAGRRLNIKLVSDITPRAITRNLFEIDHNSLILNEEILLCGIIWIHFWPNIHIQHIQSNS
jgi:hypothetical protein